MRWFDHISIFAKVSLAPLLGLLCLILLSIGTILSLNRIDAMFDQLQHDAITPYQHAASLQNDLLVLYAELFRISTMAANGKATDQLKNEAALVASMSKSLTTGDRLSTISPTIAQELKTYTSAADDTIAVLQTDPSLATILMSNTEFAFNAISASLRDATASADGRRLAIFHSARESSNRAMMQLTILIGVSIVGGVVISLLSARAIATPVVGLTRTMERLAEGDALISISGWDRRDEIGAMARALEVFRANRVESERLAEERERHQRQELERASHIRDLSARFEAEANATVREVTDALADLRTTAGGLNDTASHSSHETEAVAMGIGTASTSSQTVASSAEELSASVQEIRRSIDESRRISQEGVMAVERGASLIQELAEAADRIGEIVGLIQAIAAKTNLLALNATIESARAGEAGKGFAVVAGEVKSLATKTAEATAEISDQIADIQQATAGAVEAVDEISNIIRGMTQVGNTIAGAVEQQAAATAEIAHAAVIASDCTLRASKAMDDVREAVRETGNAAGRVLGTADHLAQRATFLQSTIECFVGSVRVA